MYYKSYNRNAIFMLTLIPVNFNVINFNNINVTKSLRSFIFNAEKERRKKYYLCLYCNGLSYYTNNCRLKL